MDTGNPKKSNQEVPIVSTNKSNNSPNEEKFFSFSRDGKDLSVVVTTDWFVNATKIAQFFGKRIRDWLRNNSKLVKYFQETSGEDPIVRTFKGRHNGGTWVSFELLIQIAQSYDPIFAWKVSSWFKRELHQGELKIKQLQLSLDNLKSKKPKMTLSKGPYLYGYLCNGVLKAGDSLVNTDGTHNRTNSHASSVPRLQYDYIIYMDKIHIIEFRKLLKMKFDREQHNRDHFLCSAKEAETFIIDYCKLLDINYESVSKWKLKEYSNRL